MVNKAPLSPQQIQQRLWIRKIVKSSFFAILISALAFVFAYWWQGTSTLETIENSLWFVFALELTISWSLFVYNQNIFSPLLHGTKTFLLMFIGKKPKEDYYTYYRKVEANQVPKFYITVAFITTFVILVLAIVTMNLGLQASL